jgi:hypothetical protein
VVNIFFRYRNANLSKPGADASGFFLPLFDWDLSDWQNYHLTLEYLACPLHQIDELNQSPYEKAFDFSGIHK